MRKKDRPVVSLDIVQLFAFDSLGTAQRPCRFINWCFGYMKFFRDYPFWFVRRTGRSGSVEFRINGPAWECLHCGEVEPVEGLEKQAILLADFWFAQHGGKNQIQPELPGIEKMPNLVVVHSL